MIPLVLALCVGLEFLILSQTDKWSVKIIVNSIVGLLLLWLVNQFGASFDIYLPYSPVSILVSGIFGFPGVLVLVLLRAFM